MKTRWLGGKILFTVHKVDGNQKLYNNVIWVKGFVVLWLMKVSLYQADFVGSYENPSKNRIFI